MDRQRAEPAAIGGDGSRAGLTQSSGPRFAEMFGATSNGGFRNREEFFKVAASGLFDQRLYGASMNESTPAEGGFSVPTQYSADLMDAALESEIVRPRAKIYPMTTATRKIAGFDTLNHTSGSIAGFEAKWMAELSTNTPQVGKLRMIQLTAQKLALYVQCSNELAADGMSWDEMLGSKMIAATSFGLDQAFLTGSGVGQPLGVLNSTCTISVAKESSQSTATVITDNITKMFARLHPACMSNAVWVVNNTLVPNLLSLTLGSGTAVVRLLQPAADGGWSMLTRPVLFSEKVPALGTKGDIMLCDFSQYAVGMRREVTLDKSQHVGWNTDESGYRTILRVDGQPLWSSAVTPVNGDTLSCFVTLAARP